MNTDHLYRVDVPNLNGSIVDTNIFNENHPEYYNIFLPIMQVITDTSSATNLSIASTFAMANTVINCYTLYEQDIKNDCFSYNGTHIPSIIIKSILAVFSKHYQQKKLHFHFNAWNPLHLSCIYPYCYEAIRLYLNQQGKSIRTGRLNSAYFFTNTNDCQYYIKTQGISFAQIYNIDIIEEYASFKGDMNWLEQLEIETFTSKDIIQSATKYWSGELTNKPIIEILFHGKYQLKN